MQTLSDKQLREVTEIIRDHHLALLVSIVGEDVVNPADVARLKRKGLIRRGSINLPEHAYEFGLLASGLEDPELQSLSLNEFMARIAQHMIPLTFEEKTAVKTVKRGVAQRLKGLGNTIDHRTQTLLIEADHKQRRRLEGRINRKMAEGIEKRKSVKEISDELARVTLDAQRDWLRVATTEVHNAFIEGRAAAIAKRNKGTDPLVYKQPRHDACPKCNEHYLEKDGVTPKLFRLSDLQAAGTTNEGRKLGHWQPTLGCLHPFCQCTLHEMPPGFAFDHKGHMTYVGFQP